MDRTQCLREAAVVLLRIANRVERERAARAASQKSDRAAHARAARSSTHYTKRVPA